MKNVHEWSVFEDWCSVPGNGTLADRTRALGLDGYELFTMIDDVPDVYCVPEVVSVHLPYAIDWRAGWEGRTYQGMPDDVDYLTFGHSRDEVARNLRKAILCAAKVHPAYGVLHAGNTDYGKVLWKEHGSDDLKIVAEFAEMINTVVSGLPGGEPPFKLAFENLWWEGLRLRSPAEWRVLEDKIEFTNWGLTLDTGHLMNTCPSAYDEDSAIDGIMSIIDTYPKDMRDRIGTVHLQLSASAEYRDAIVSDDRKADESWDDFSRRAYERATDIDQHRPFTSLRVREIVDALEPDYLNHELMGGLSGDRFGDLRKQRALFV